MNPYRKSIVSAFCKQFVHLSFRRSVQRRIFLFIFSENPVMKSSAVLLTWGLGLLFLSPFSACQTPKKEPPAASKKTQAVAAKRNASSTSNQGNGALVKVSTPDYELTIYGAFAFLPDDKNSVLKAEPGHQFVVLDLAVENTSAYKSLDMGQLLLSAVVRDEKGTVFPRSALALQAYAVQFPGDQHNADYKAMRGKIRPGHYYRATAYGFEAPMNVRQFLMTIKEDGEFASKFVHEVRFSID